MEKYIDPREMFYLKKGMKIRLEDGKIVELLSDYIQDGLKYKCISDGEEGEMPCLKFVCGHIIEE